MANLSQRSERIRKKIAKRKEARKAYEEYKEEKLSRLRGDVPQEQAPKSNLTQEELRQLGQAVKEGGTTQEKPIFGLGTVPQQQRPVSYGGSSSRFLTDAGGRVVGIEDVERGKSYAIRPTPISQVRQMQSEAYQEAAQAREKQRARQEEIKSRATRYGLSSLTKEEVEEYKKMGGSGSSVVSGERFYKEQGFKEGKPSGVTLSFFGITPEKKVLKDMPTRGLAGAINPAYQSYESEKEISEKEKALRAGGYEGTGLFQTYKDRGAYGEAALASFKRAPYEYAARPIETAAIAGTTLLFKSPASAETAAPLVVGLIGGKAAYSDVQARRAGGTGARALGEAAFDVSLVGVSLGASKLRQEALRKGTAIDYKGYVGKGVDFKAGKIYEGKIYLKDIAARWEGKPAKAYKVLEYKGGELVSSTQSIGVGKRTFLTRSYGDFTATKVFEGIKLKSSGLQYTPQRGAPSLKVTSLGQSLTNRVVIRQTRVKQGGLKGSEIRFIEQFKTTARGRAAKGGFRFETEVVARDTSLRKVRATDELIYQVTRKDLLRTSKAGKSIGGELITPSRQRLKPEFVFDKPIEYKPKMGLEYTYAPTKVTRTLKFPSQYFEPKTAFVKELFITEKVRYVPIWDRLGIRGMGKKGSLAIPEVAKPKVKPKTFEFNIPGRTPSSAFNYGTSTFMPQASSVTPKFLPLIRFSQTPKFTQETGAVSRTGATQRLGLDMANIFKVDVGVSSRGMVRTGQFPIRAQVPTQTQVQTQTQVPIGTFEPTFTNIGTPTQPPSQPLIPPPIVPPSLMFMFPTAARRKRGGVGRKGELVYRPSFRGLITRMKATKGFKTMKLTGFEVRGL